MAEPSADVLIIGAGASGGVAARRFVDAGMRVVCLEQGDWPDPAAYPGAGDDWELRGAKQWSGNPAVRAAPADYPLDVTESDFGVLNFNGVGGGTVLYNAQWPRMLPDDFRVHTVDGVADDWPLTYAELQPFYEETDRQFGVSGLGGNPLYPPGADPPLPPLPIGTLATRVARAHARLGWHWWPEANAILSAPYADRHVCVQRGTCGYGCNEGAKGSTDVTHWPYVVARGGTVITGARVRRIAVDTSGLACGAEWLDADGGEHFQPADVVVMAANAVGTARLLLASTSAAHPDGLANSSGLVGKRLMLHPLVSVSGLFDGPADGWRAHNGGLIQSLQFGDSDQRRGFARGAKWALGTAGGPLRYVFAPDGKGMWGDEHHRNVRDRLGRTASWVLICEDLPEECNRVELSPELIDDSGLAAPKVVYRTSENTRRLMAWHTERAKESLQAAGAWQLEVIHHRNNGHLMGTARMGDDPATSVVDRWGLAHDVPNLLIVDGSVFVTAGSANPTSTIAALALRAADHLVTSRRSIPVPAHTSQPAAAASPRRAATPVPPPTGRLDVEDRERLAALADRLIPAGDDMPAASVVGVHVELIDRVIAARPDLLAGLRAGLAMPPDEAAQDSRVRYALAAAYYLSPDVRARLEYRTTDPVPVRPDVYPDYIAEGLLDHLLAAAPAKET